MPACGSKPSCTYLLYIAVVYAITHCGFIQDQVGEDVETEETGDKEKLEEEEGKKEKEESRRDVGLVVVAAVAGCIVLVVGTIATARLYRRNKERR